LRRIFFVFMNLNAHLMDIPHAEFGLKVPFSLIDPNLTKKTVLRQNSVVSLRVSARFQECCVSEFSTRRLTA